MSDGSVRSFVFEIGFLFFGSDLLAVR